MNIEQVKKYVHGEFARYRQHLSVLIFPLSVLLFVLLFPRVAVRLVSAIIVDPLLSTFTISSTLADIIIMAGMAYIIFFFINKALKGVIISILLGIYSIAIPLLYLIFRMHAGEWFNFVPFNWSAFSHFYLLDILILPLPGLVLYYVLIFFKFLFTEDGLNKEQKGFYTDEPFTLTEDNDPFFRRQFIKELSQKILATDTVDQSFAIGIIGPWGSGKTSFMNELERQLKTEKQVIQFAFNPWLAGKDEGIAVLFFSEFSSIISHYDNSLGNDVLSYSRDLLQVLDNPVSRFFSSIIGTTSKDKDLVKKHRQINRSIKHLGKKVIIYVDDVDRLDEHELAEVMRLIRNTANFSNTFFIVAFDKVYVAKGIESKFKNGLHNYLEKIFQLEYYLPIIPDHNVYANQVLEILKKLSDENTSEVIEIIKAGKSDLFHFEILPPIKHYIKSFRDVKRFMNVFMLNYEQIKHNIYLPDFISICLLRLKYPEVYKLIYFEKFKILVNEHGDLPDDVGLMYLSPDSQDNSKSTIQSILEKNPGKYAIGEHELDVCMNLISSIFRSGPTNNFQNYSRTLFNHHLAITEGSCFTRYFDFYMGGRLDQFEFNIVMNGIPQEIEKKFKEWNSSRTLNNDLRIKLENYNDLKTKEQFEKAIRAIVLFANLPNPFNPDQKNMFIATNLFMKMSGSSNNYKIVDSIYKGDPKPYKDFFIALYKENVNSDNWEFLTEFIITLVNRGENGFILTSLELKELLIDTFIWKVNNAEKLSWSILHYYSVVVRFFIDKDGNYENLPNGPIAFINDSFRQFVTKDFAWFLGFLLIKNDENLYMLDSFQNDLFNGKEAFEKYLNEKVNDERVAEFIRYYNIAKLKSKPIPFRFEKLSLPDYKT